LAASPDQEAFDRDVRLRLYGRFVETGRPPSAAETAEALGVAPGEVESAYRRLHDERVIVLHPGTTEVWMANPLSAVPTPFSVEAGGRSFFGNCVWDALGVVAMLGGTGRVTTTCPDCGDPLALQVREGSLFAGDGLVHYEVPARRWWDDIGYT
jgi:hypothetical protein